MNKPKDTSGEFLMLAMMAAMLVAVTAFATLERRQIHEVFTAITLALTIGALVRTRKAAS